MPLAAALFERVTFSSDIALILVPLGKLPCVTYMPTNSPVAEPTTASGVPAVVFSDVDTCMRLDAEPLALSRPTPMYALLGRPNVVAPSPTPYGAKTIAVVADVPAFADIDTCVLKSTLLITAPLGTAPPGAALMGIPGDMLDVSDRPVMIAEPLTRTPDCWIVMALNSGASVTRFLFEPSHQYHPVGSTMAAVSLTSPDWKPCVAKPSNVCWVGTSAAVRSARPAAVLSEIAEEKCVCDVGALAVSRACKDVWTSVVREPEGVTAIIAAATRAIVEKSSTRTHLVAARSVPHQFRGSRSCWRGSWSP